MKNSLVYLPNHTESFPTQVLILETDPTFQQLMHGYLKEMDLTPVFETDTRHALTYAEQHYKNIAIIILHYQSDNPEIKKFLEKLHSIPNLHNIPVIATTTEHSKKLAKGIEQGIYYFLPKPCDQQLFLYVTRQIITVGNHKRKMAKEIELSSQIKDMVKTIDMKFHSVTEAQDLSVYLSSYFPHHDTHVVGLSELLVNAIEHGNLGIGYELKKELVLQGKLEEEIQRRSRLSENQSKYSSVHLLRSLENISVTIHDCGKGFNFDKYLDFDKERITDPNGRGIAVANANHLAKLIFHLPGNSVTYSAQFNT